MEEKIFLKQTSEGCFMKSENSERWQSIHKTNFDSLSKRAEKDPTIIVEGKEPAEQKEPLVYKFFMDEEGTKRLLAPEPEYIGVNPDWSKKRDLDDVEEIIKARAGDRPFTIDRLSFYEPWITPAPL
jgi:hypothetical protein